MGKNKNKRRRSQMLLEAARKHARKDEEGARDLPSIALGDAEDPTVEDSDEDGSMTNEEVSDDALNQVVRTLSLLTKTPQQMELVRYSKRFKELRRVLHPLVVQQIKAFDKGTDYRTKTTVHLVKKEYIAALSSLRACQELYQIPKQGTIQRWVREVDSCEEGSQKIQLLSMILSLGEETEDSSVNVQHVSSEYVGLNKHDPKIALIQAQRQQSADSSIQILDSWKIPDREDAMENATEDIIVHKDEEDLSFSSRTIFFEKGSERTPPNHYDLILHFTTPTQPNKSIVPFGQGQTVSCHGVPFIAGGMALQNVLSSDECRNLVRIATKLGYRPDHPTSLDQPTGIDSCEWMIDDAIHSIIFQRVRALLPETSDSILNMKKYDGKKPTFRLHSINRRWRFFRYGQGCVYRPHIDGSWPQSRLSACGEHYETDTSGRTKSFLTFLIYLNDDFEGGATRFYHPCAETGGMVAHGVQPKRGSVLVFPQGNTASLLHEGSAVTKGTKFVVRTDVLYRSAEDDSNDV